MIRKIKKILTSKINGQGELITNTLTITVLFIMMIFFIDAYSDLKIKDNLDNVARKYILILETTNTINGNDILVDIDKATGGDGTKSFESWVGKPKVTVVVDGKGTVLVDESVINVNSSYGDIITLNIEGDMLVRTGRWASAFDVTKDNVVDLVISKSSTAKH